MNVPQVGRIVVTLEDGSEYIDLTPLPCEREAYVWLDPEGEPYGMMIDGRAYRIRHSPRLSVPGHFTMIGLCRRLQPGE